MKLPSHVFQPLLVRFSSSAASECVFSLLNASFNITRFRTMLKLRLCCSISMCTFWSAVIVCMMWEIRNKRMLWIWSIMSTSLVALARSILLQCFIEKCLGNWKLFLRLLEGSVCDHSNHQAQDRDSSANICYSCKKDGSWCKHVSRVEVLKYKTMV